MIIERLQVKGTIDIQVTITVNGITQTGSVIQFRTSHPGIMGRDRGTLYPREQGPLPRPLFGLERLREAEYP